MDHYAVIGNPIKHSVSPVIHREFAKQTHQEIDYDSHLVEQNGLAEFFSDFFKNGKGLNVTVPHKQSVLKLADTISKRAEYAGAANTIAKGEDGKIFADNTDGAGFINDALQNHSGSFEGKRILVLGAGGAVRGIMLPLLEQQPEKIVIANRTLSRANQLKQKFGNQCIDTAEIHDIPNLDFDWVINGTSAGLNGEAPTSQSGLVLPHTWCYDMIYGDNHQAFKHWAVKQGSENVLDGLGMLIEQAAESFFIWRGVRPDTKSVIEFMRNR